MAGAQDSAPFRSPINQNSMPRSLASGASANIMVMMAPQPEASITPVSNSRGEASMAPSICCLEKSRLTKANRRTMDTSAPAAALRLIAKTPRPASIAPSAPTAAPPDSPST